MVERVGVTNVRDVRTGTPTRLCLISLGTRRPPLKGEV